jgi:hypothetical protein
MPDSFINRIKMVRSIKKRRRNPRSKTNSLPWASTKRHLRVRFVSWCQYHHVTSAVEEAREDADSNTFTAAPRRDPSEPHSRNASLTSSTIPGPDAGSTRRWRKPWNRGDSPTRSSS